MSGPDTRSPMTESEMARWVRTIVNDERAFRESVIRQLAEISANQVNMEKKLDQHVADDLRKFAGVEQSIDASNEKSDESRGKLNYILGGAAVGAFMVATAVAVARMLT